MIRYDSKDVPGVYMSRLIIPWGGGAHHHLNINIIIMRGEALSSQKGESPMSVYQGKAVMIVEGVSLEYSGGTHTNLSWGFS